MTHHALYQRRESANLLGAVLSMSSAAGVVVAVLTMLSIGFLAGFAVLLLSLVAYALGRLLEHFGELLVLLADREEKVAAAERRATTGDAGSVTP